MQKGNSFLGNDRSGRSVNIGSSVTDGIVHDHTRKQNPRRHEWCKAIARSVVPYITCSGDVIGAPRGDKQCKMTQAEPEPIVPTAKCGTVVESRGIGRDSRNLPFDITIFQICH